MDNIKRVSLLLPFVAGFCDASTYIAADKLFSAHVTGNFIVLASDIVGGADKNEWAKLLSFPVFVGAVLAAGLLYRKEGYTYRLLVIEGGLLLMAGMLAAGLLPAGVLSAAVLPGSIAKMLVVAAMGIQNAFGQLYSKAAYGTTTTMTGNVTGAVLAFVPGWLRVPGDVESAVRFKQIVIMILAFLLGCIAGATLSHRWGLMVVALPGAMVTAYFFRRRVREAKKMD